MMTKYANSQSQLAWPGPACQAAAAMTRYESATPAQPSAILLMVDGSDPFAAWRVHSATTNGVKAKIMNGLNARNHVVGISAVKPRKSIVRSVLASAHKTIVLPPCSYVAQNKAVGTNKAKMAVMPRHSWRVRGRLSACAALAFCSSSAGNK